MSHKSALEPILPGLFRFRDTCNVYLLKSGSRGILIDSGSGAILSHLGEAGVRQIEWVTHTHAHRDQCIGDKLLRDHGAKIAVGAEEESLLAPQGLAPPFMHDEFLEREAFSLPRLPRRADPFCKAGADRGLRQGDMIKTGGLSLRVLDTPGHTRGSKSFLWMAGKKRICFSGDLLMAGGVLRDFWSLQWIYLENPGIGAALSSLAQVTGERPNLLLPSHGRPILNPRKDMGLLRARLEAAGACLRKDPQGRWNWSDPVQLSRHVVQDCGSTSQIVLSQDGSGRALFFDYGEHFSPQKWKELRGKFGLEKVEVVIPSHWHPDHIDGINALVRETGAKVWVWEGLAEHIEHPERFLTTCERPSSLAIKADRILRKGEAFEWGGHSFRVLHHPAHTEQQMALFAKVDGKAFYFSADGLGYTRNEPLRCSLHCGNGVSIGSGLLQTARSFFEANPYVCVPAHSNCFAATSETRKNLLTWAEETTVAIARVLGPPHPEIKFNPYWASFYPALTRTDSRKRSLSVELRFSNPTKRRAKGQVRLKAYGNLDFESPSFSYELGPGASASFPLRVKVRPGALAGYHVITADIEFGADLFGELPYAYVCVEE